MPRLTHRQKSLRKEREDARYIRAWIIRMLGGQCALCSRRRGLELDHVGERTWRCRDHSRLDRMRKYMQDFVEGRLRLLCRYHNAKDGAHRRWKKHKHRTNSGSFVYAPHAGGLSPLNPLGKSR